MKKIIAAVLFLIPCSSFAQATDSSFEHVTVHVSQNKCNSGQIGDLVSQYREKIAPIFNRAVEDGDLINWGILTHNFGDEWNFNFFLVTEDNVSMMEFWNGFWEQLSENWSTYGEDFGAICSEHKDNIYRQVAGYVPAEGS